MRSELVVADLASATHAAYGYPVSHAVLKATLLCNSTQRQVPTAVVVAWLLEEPIQFLIMLPQRSAPLKNCVFPLGPFRNPDVERRLLAALQGLLEYIRESESFNSDWSAHSSPAEFTFPPKERSMK